MKGDDVSALQNILIQEGVYSEGIVSGFFGERTRRAVIAFQEKYASEILSPFGLSRGSGIVGNATRNKLETLSH
jgi:peptidoglycan hydrolase-like protein with peptidoglycan-binding domain